MRSLTRGARKFAERQMQKQMHSNKKGQIIDTTTSVIIGLFVLVLIVFAILFGISALDPTSFFTAGSAEQQSVNNSLLNFTKGVNNFFAQIPAAMKILGVVLIIGFLALLIVIVIRFRGQAGAGNGGGL